MKIKSLTKISLSAALICICTVVIPPINIGGINLTLQTLMIMLIGSTMLPVEAFLSVLLYVLIGILGLPVFSGYKSGIGVILGPTGFFILAFPIATYFISILKGKSFPRLLIVNVIIGIGFTYLVGVVGLALYNKTSYFTAFKIMLIFIPFDIIKAILATLIARKIKDFM